MVAMMADIMDRPVETFTVGFQDAGASFIDERRYARELASRYRLNHHEIEVTPSLEEIIWEVLDAFDQPFADDSIVPTFYICKLAGSHVKVALTGLGGDELFAGYRRHLGLVLGDTYARLPRFLTRGIIEPLLRRIPESRNSSDYVDHLKRFSRSADADAPARYQDSLSSLPWHAAGRPVRAAVAPRNRSRHDRGRRLLHPFVAITAVPLSKAPCAPICSSTSWMTC